MSKDLEKNFGAERIRIKEERPGRLGDMYTEKMVANRQGPYEWREYQNAAVAILFRDDIFVGEVREREGGWVSTSVESAGQKGISKPSRWHTQVAASKAEAQALTLNTAQAFFNDGPEGPELP